MWACQTKRDCIFIFVFIFILVWCFNVVVCFIGAVLFFCTLFSQYNPLGRMIWDLYIFLLNWCLPLFQSAVTILLVPLPVYWSVLFYRVTILKALLVLIVFFSAHMLVCSCHIDLTFYTLFCFYNSTHSPA